MAGEDAETVRFGQQQLLVESEPGSGIFTAPCGITSLTRSTTLNTNDEAIPKCGDPDALLYMSVSPTSKRMQVTFSGTLAQQAIPLWDSWSMPDSNETAARKARWYRHIGTPNQGYWEGPALLTEYSETSEGGGLYTNSGTVIWQKEPVWHSIPPAPGVTTAVSIPTTAPQVGTAFAATAGTYTGTPTLSYQWFREGVEIDGATTISYTPVAADEGKTLYVVEIATNVSGSINSRSDDSLAVQAAP